ncbi:hypothetical protein M9979_16040 [Sphingomonas sp. RP10(2022)]|uniref:EF-hand domain-containing protein n=1 Tax=Sphingomonas liriopis TaxID=2949094 RepID=A0A9X2KUX3_9SPHN|nr:hypothetical protein [Sphingomonas liriopis]MCP3736378.1 hypothetical protein [Sphingomonas liriopis]
MLTGCGKRDEKLAAADANAADFVPPAVTSRVDFTSAMERRFRGLDHNGDDHLDATELPRANSRLMAMDRDKDGQISAIEWSEGTLRRFDQMDLNHDGTVTSEEESEWRAARDAGRAPAAQPTGPVLGDALSNRGTGAR